MSITVLTPDVVYLRNGNDNSSKGAITDRRYGQNIYKATMRTGGSSVGDEQLIDEILAGCNKIVFLNNQTITQVGEQNQFLGIYIDRHLTWKKYINDVIYSKIYIATFVINRVKHCFTTLFTKISIINSQ